MNEKTIEIESIINEKVDYKRLADSIKLGFENYFEINFEDYER